MAESETPSVRGALRVAITTAMKQRDRRAAAVYRAALASIDNAEAVPPGSEHRAGAVESSALGVGRADVPRGVLSEHDMREVVAAEAGERRSAAQLVESRDAAAADRLRAEAELLHDLLHRLEPGHR